MGGSGSAEVTGVSAPGHASSHNGRRLRSAAPGVDSCAMVTREAGWKRGLSSRLRRIADTIDIDASLAETLTPDLPPPPPLPAFDANDPAAHDRALDALIEECYPTVAAKVLSLAHQGTHAPSDDWIIVARLLYEAHMHRVGGPPELARMRALVATFSQAIEGQARSSARLAGYHDSEHDNLSTIEGDDLGTLVWQHYLCPSARLARQAIHGETVGDWLTALGELWASTKAITDSLETAEARGPVDGAPEANDADATSDEADHRRSAPDDPLLLRAKVALARVEELALW